ncbi:cobyrinic acid a,c-diamide synthase [Desulfurivibrio alkaliphilus AHT 2]|uniref:Cobyrinate a,c-diamide synthase n=1 Tax=Desulfurivibrio alkaliphilus (strain DSM 19089 / UNIQEM U267 / AHT2) TaxID=589865 RepID=D6Z401_DESAT|nr:cobyrinic acid a,c-diamide synthase [Desulfurivibrio alkaliphilus AHT 2]
MAGTHSGCGKTTVTLGLLAALTRRGNPVQPFKCGPDFIDPTLHQLVTGRHSCNLDPWITGPEYVRQLFQRHCRPGELGLIEGVMGMFDGGNSSAAALARLLAVPVVLVLDAKAAAESAAAVLKGFEVFSPDIAPAAVILNRVGSERHRRRLCRAIEQHCRSEIIGTLPRDLEFSIPERHLGLRMGSESPLSAAALDKLAAAIEQHVGLDRLLALAGNMESDLKDGDASKPVGGGASIPVRLGVAKDAAFCFYYQDNFALLEAAGAELVFFSPLADHALPPGLDGLYLGGGYPELHARQLAANREMCSSIRAFAEGGGVIYGECGGFMYLCRGIEDFDGVLHPLAGIFPVRAAMGRRLAALGYREAVTTRDGLFGPAGTRLRGHEFHYSRTEAMPEHLEQLYHSTNLDGGAGASGWRRHNTVAGYLHLHFASNPEAAAAFVKNCRDHKP